MFVLAFPLVTLYLKRSACLFCLVMELESAKMAWIGVPIWARSGVLIYFGFLLIFCCCCRYHEPGLMVLIVCLLFPVVAGIMNLARSGSMKLRNSFRRHNSTHKREEHMTNSQVRITKTRASTRGRSKVTVLGQSCHVWLVCPY